MTRAHLIAATALLIAVVAFLSGCAHTPKYLNRSCITREQLEQLKAAKPGKIHDSLTGKADEDLKLVTGRLIRVESYADGLIQVLGNCAG